MDKKTAVDYLIDQLLAPCRGVPSHIIEEAKRLEKEQIIDAYDYGYYCASNGTSAEITLDGKMHYNQRYNQKQHIIDIMKADEEDGLYNQNKSNGE